MDKIKVNLSYLCYSTLLHDAEAFGILKKNGEVNMNYFYNEVIVHLYEKRWNSINQIKKHYNDYLSKYLPEEKLDTIVNDITKSIYDNYNDLSKQYHANSILIRPRKEYEIIFETIIENHLSNDTISNYFRSLFLEYSSLNQDDRELLLFEKIVDDINKAITSNSKVKLKINDEYVIFAPYCISATKEKLYNFVIGSVKDRNIKKIIPIHLYKIKQVLPLKESYFFSKQEIASIENMILQGPQYFINNYCSACIQLTYIGQKKWKKMYLNRPIPYLIEENKYFFECSFEQLFQYFIRFGKEVTVIYPNQLKNALIKFHQEAYLSLTNQIEEIKNK